MKEPTQSRNKGKAAQRSRRGRILLVGKLPRLDELSRQLPDTALRADTLFDAIGAVSTASARDPITTVLIPVDLCGQAAQSAAAALRYVDPSVRLVAVTSNGPENTGDESACAGFDDRLHIPASDDAIASLVEGRPVSPVQHNGHHKARSETPPPPPPPPRRPTELEAPRADAPQSDKPSDPPAEVSEHLAPEVQLGDVDLVDALLNGAAHTTDTALNIIRQQTGWQDVKLGEVAGAPANAAMARVTCQGRTYAALTSTQATAGELEPWADWLGRWLALDETLSDLRLKAYTDELTGAWNRRFFGEVLRRNIDMAREHRRPVTLMVLDIDNFKKYNDCYGHAAGDEMLRETVRMLNTVIRKGDHVCRIGGDEFVVLFVDPEGPREPGSRQPDTVEQIARRFQDQISEMRFPKLGSEAPGNLSISAGLAAYPWDGADPDTLLDHADQLALQSKRKGKNAITFGPGALSVCRKPPEE